MSFEEEFRYFTDSLNLVAFRIAESESRCLEIGEAPEVPAFEQCVINFHRGVAARAPGTQAERVAASQEAAWSYWNECLAYHRYAFVEHGLRVRTVREKSESENVDHQSARGKPAAEPAPEMRGATRLKSTDEDPCEQDYVEFESPLYGYGDLGGFGSLFEVKLPPELHRYQDAIESMLWSLRNTGESSIEQCTRYSDLPVDVLSTLEKYEKLHVVDGDVVRFGTRTAIDTFDVPPLPEPWLKKIPRWQEPLAVDAEFRENLPRYYLHYRACVLNGVVPEVPEGYLGAPYTVLKELRGARTKGFTPELRKVCELFADAYRGNELGRECARYLAHDEIYNGDYAAAYQRLRNADLEIPLDIYVNLLSYVECMTFTRNDLQNWIDLPAGLTEFGIDHYELVEDRVMETTEHFADLHGMNVVEDLWHRADHTNLEALLTCEDLWITERTIASAERAILRERHHPELSNGPRLFGGPIGAATKEFVWPDWKLSWWFSQILTTRIRYLFRVAEEQIRSEMRVPEVGAVYREILLLRQLEKAFSEEQVVGQGRPEWLGQQSYDIWFPERLVAVEYQGEQHSRPVAFFGGEEKFKDQLERDERKRRLSKEHGVTLIEVFPDYDLSEVSRQVGTAINNPIAGTTE